jgi:isopentenyl diphosphate isomerase/L-lactate dehydrogenase-like FMN-dependent dehydrogenase
VVPAGCHASCSMRLRVGRETNLRSGLTKRPSSTYGFGQERWRTSASSIPLLLAPCGFARLANSDAELAIARAAARSDTVYVVSGASSYPLEDIAQAAPDHLWYQIYLPPDKKATDALIDRVEAAGYGTLCISIDTAIAPKRERDVRNGLTLPLRPTPRLVFESLANPSWTKDFLLGRVGGGQRFGNYPGAGAAAALANFTSTVTHLRSVTMADVRDVRARWPGKLVLKGIMRGDECREIAELGVDGLIVSNHGGRNLDGVRPTIEILPEVVQAVSPEVEVLVDGGIRRGTDIMKCLALGASACLIGRPYLYGLAVAGEPGVSRVVEMLRTEFEQAMGLAGCARVADIDSSLVTRSTQQSEL